MLLCKYCGKECKNHNSLINHERLCRSNPNKQRSNLSGSREPWNKGKTKEIDARIMAGTDKRKRSIETGRYIPHKTKHSEEMKLYLSKKMKERYDSGWECVAGRCPKYNYSSPIAGDIKVDGSWELTFCQYADKVGLTWRRNLDRFVYIKPDGKKSTYQPDFYVAEWNSYVEVKGYETELDRAKWSQFPENLIILRRSDISELDERLKSAPC